MMKFNYAAIDLGSNSCRLQICNSAGKDIYNNHYSTRLAEGMQQNNNISKEAFVRAEDTFIKIAEQLKNYHVLPENVRAIATAACRMANNGKILVDKIFEISGIKLEIIDGQEEALLTLQGAAEHVRGKSKYVIVWDLGGGSTEITLAYNNDNPQIIRTISIPYGARNSAEKFELHEYNEKNANLLRQQIDEYIDKFLDGLDCFDNKQTSFVATSSSSLRLVSMIESRKIYERNWADGKIIKTAKLQELLPILYKSSLSELENNSCIGKERAPIFIAACVIFSRIVERLGADNIVASLKSAKDAIIANFILKD